VIVLIVLVTTSRESTHRNWSLQAKHLEAKQQATGPTDELSELIKVADQRSRIDARRVLTSEDFDRIKKLKVKVSITAIRGPHVQRRTRLSKMLAVRGGAAGSHQVEQAEERGSDA
jgi:hypothetical protein